MSVKQKPEPRTTPRPRDESSKLKVIIIGAGLGGLATAITTLLAGHTVIVIESAKAISEVGAGIQCLPNSTRILKSWDISNKLFDKASQTETCNILSWKGEMISSMEFRAAGEEHGASFNDFHRADLHSFLLERAGELGASIYTNSEVTDITFDDEDNTATVHIKNRDPQTADLIIGADGINSRCREILLGREDKPHRTGDMAYRILLEAADVRKHPELKCFLDEKAVYYWYGPGAHVVTYPLRNASKLNLVLLVPDNMPEEGPSTLQGYVDEMKLLFKEWDPRLNTLLTLCPSVLRWRLCIRTPLSSWVHPSASFALLGDAAHATLPYLASGAGITFEDAAVLGECLSRLKSRSKEEKKKVLAVYEKCRKLRTERVVERGTVQQDLNHLDDGEEQMERDRKMRAFEDIERDWKSGKQEALPEGLVEGEDPLVWRRFGVGGWLFGYDAWEDVETKWKP
ncbi:hypothetical protein BDW69DRAFT_205031 [Aspergillus filifer]